jgi:hypothetical protein
MAVLLVLCPSANSGDGVLREKIAAYTNIQVHPGTWLLDTHETVEAVRDKLGGAHSRDDQLLVFRIARRWAASRIDDHTLWLKALERVWGSGKQTRPQIG